MVTTLLCIIKFHESAGMRNPMVLEKIEKL